MVCLSFTPDLYLVSTVLIGYLFSSEHLIKQYLQTSKQEPIYIEMWNQALEGVRKHLVTYSADANVTVLGELPDGIGGELLPRMEHLACFLPGTIALGATGGLPLEEARKLSTWSVKQESEMALAQELTQTCWGMYKVNPTGLASEITHFRVHTPPLMEAGHVVVPLEHLDDDPHAAWRKDYLVDSHEAQNLQRPETAESLFYMWRITGDERYRVWGWEIFKAFIEHTDIGMAGGFTSLADVTHVPPTKRDNMESFWLVRSRSHFLLVWNVSANHLSRPKLSNTSTSSFPPTTSYPLIGWSSTLERTFSLASNSVNYSRLAGSDRNGIKMGSS
jgi:mannosyl-oligosaccharide alpha-1,2-mannosidase